MNIYKHLITKSVIPQIDQVLQYFPWSITNQNRKGKMIERQNTLGVRKREGGQSVLDSLH